MSRLGDGRVGRLARVLVDYSTAVGPGDVTLITAPTQAAPLVHAVYERVLAAGGHPVARAAVEGLSDTLLSEGTEAQIEWVNPVRVQEIDEADVHISIRADPNTRSLSRVAPSRLAALARSQEEVRTRVLDRAAAGDIRWVLTVYPNHAAAQEAEMSLADYEDFVYGAGFVDDDDPEARWREFAGRLEGTASFLNRFREIRVVAEGTDLTVGFEGRTWVASSGRENFPDGEIFTGPVETSLEGTIRFTYPAIFQRREVDDVRLRFERGEVVEAEAARGESLLQEMLALDEGARRAGEFAFGLNDSIQRFTRNTLFDEKIGGTVHLALGHAYPETGGLNRSALHWDMICDLRGGSEVYADGELVYRDGRFLDGVGAA